MRATLPALALAAAVTVVSGSGCAASSSGIVPGFDGSFTGGGSEGQLADASVKLGKRLSDKLYAAYEHSLSGAGGTLMIFYELSRRWTLRGQAGENTAVDLIYRLSFD